MALFILTEILTAADRVFCGTLTYVLLYGGDFFQLFLLGYFFLFLPCGRSFLCCIAN